MSDAAGGGEVPTSSSAAETPQQPNAITAESSQSGPAAVGPLAGDHASCPCDHADHEMDHDHPHSDDEMEQEGTNEAMDQTRVEDIVRLDAECVELQFLRVGSTQGLMLDRLTHCKSLSLHRNLLHKLDPLPQNLAATLTSLDVSDNKIKRMPDHLGQLRLLVKLDLSYNNLRVIENLDALTGLQELYLQGNKITQIQGLTCLTELTLLELGANRIREIQGLETLTNLRQLFLGKNKIRVIEGLSTLNHLTLLSLQNNRIGEIAGLEGLLALEELYISENGITALTNLRHLRGLRLLDVAVNRLEHLDLEELRPMEKLRDLWANDNRLASWAEIAKLSAFPLADVYFRHNPIYSDPRYRAKIMDLLPSVRTIDSLPVR